MLVRKSPLLPLPPSGRLTILWFSRLPFHLIFPLFAHIFPFFLSIFIFVCLSLSFLSFYITSLFLIPIFIIFPLQGISQYPRGGGLVFSLADFHTMKMELVVLTLSRTALRRCWTGSPGTSTTTTSPPKSHDIGYYIRSTVRRLYLQYIYISCRAQRIETLFWRCLQIKINRTTTENGFDRG
jgi:hypothetical protein